MVYFLGKSTIGNIFMTSMYVYHVARLEVPPGTTTVPEDSPLTFSTVQVYVPTISS